MATKQAQTLLEASGNGDTETVARILGEHPELVNVTGDHQKTPLHWATEGYHLQVARLLIDAGAAVGCRTSWGATPLEWAGVLGSLDVAELLLERGAEGLNLSVAAGLGKLDVVQRFCEGDDSLEGLGIERRPGDAEDTRGWPPDSAHMLGDVLGEAFQLACRNGHVDVARYLARRGAPINAKGYFGGTGLHWAAIEGHLEMVEFLLDQGADVNLKDHGFDATPLGWAMEGGHQKSAELIESFGAAAP